jgi:Mce-associated membrane protein
VPPHRRRPAPSTGQAPPIRRPRVAGTRNRTDRQDSDVRIEEEDRVSGVLSGLRGTPPSRPEADDDTETTILPRYEDPLDEPEIDPETNEPPAVTDDEPEPPKPRRKAAVAKGATTRPAGKRRTTGMSRPDDLAAAETEAVTEPRRTRTRRDAEPATRTAPQFSVAIILAVVAVVLVIMAIFFRGKADDLTSGDSNTALTDSATTSQVKGQLTNAIKQTFSYNYTDLGATERAVKENLTGKALCEYNLLFGEVKKYAPEQKIVLDTTVRELGIVRIDGDRAEALVYIDQLSTRVDVNKTVAVGGQFAVQAKRDGNHWKITEFDMFGQPLFNGKPAPTC